MKKLFTFAVIIFAFILKAHSATRQDTTAQQAPVTIVTIMANVPHFYVEKMDMNSKGSLGNGVVTICPIRRHKNKNGQYTYEWDAKGILVTINIDNLPHNGYPGHERGTQIDYVPIDFKTLTDNSVDPTTFGYKHFVDNIPGKWYPPNADDPNQLETYVYDAGSYAFIDISMNTTLYDESKNSWKYLWYFEGMAINHKVVFVPKS